MILLIDNYDSFSYNLYQLVGSVESDIKVIRNDEYTIEEIEKMEPDALIISPGPGRPEDAGVCIDAIKYFAEKMPILGVCLGHQAICEAFGGRVTYANELMHGSRAKYIRVAAADFSKAWDLSSRQRDTIPCQLQQKISRSCLW